MAVKRPETGSFAHDIRKKIQQGKNVRIFITLFDRNESVAKVERVVRSINASISGIIVNDALMNCRNVTMHEKINNLTKSCGYDVYSLKDVKLLGDKDEDVVIIVENKYTFLYKIINVFENSSVNCTVYHISDLNHKMSQIDTENGHLPIESDCCGCTACANICPTQAITMEYSDKGFLVPVINKDKCVNCNLCTNTCPSLNPTFTNDKEPEFYSFCASDEIRAESSSGGMFTLLAEYVLEKNGYVCGAAFEDMKCKHIIVDNSEDLAKIRGSKYVQSDMGDTYKQVKKLLEDDNYVLFTGTPCQVAGVKTFLKKGYAKLITAEVLCHGVPSQKFFDSYLESKAFNKKLVNAEFRSKKLGWSFSGMVFYFDDGTEQINKRKSVEKNIYLDAFIDNMMMRDMCYDCMFNDYSRQGDFTIGDLWHSDKLDPKSNDKKGTSFVFVNNENAKRIFETISEDAKYYKKIDVKDYYKIPNRVVPKTKINPKRERFLELLKTKSFSEAYRIATSGHFDIGMPCVMYNDNIGSVLTYYALYKTLTDMNYSVLPIERPLDSPLKISDEAKEFNKRWVPEYAQPVQYDNIFEMHDLNKKCDMFVLGSDQVFLESMCSRRNYFFMMSWVEDTKKKIAVASSFGGPGARGSDEYYRKLEYFINKYEYISCREDNGVEFANNELNLNKKVEFCLDPVFLCDKKYYKELVDSVEDKKQTPYVGAYVIIPRGPINKLITKTKEHFNNIPVEIIGDSEAARKAKDFHYECMNPFPIENALELICHSEYFVTDSFHGMCFAIIFKRDFMVIPRDFHDRFHTLLDRLGLSDRIIKNDHSNFTEELFKPIDWDSVYEKLNALISKSKTDIKNALTSDKKQKLVTDMDMLMEYILEQNRKITELEKKIEEISNK